MRAWHTYGIENTSNEGMDWRENADVFFLPDELITRLRCRAPKKKKKRVSFSGKHFRMHTFDAVVAGFLSLFILFFVWCLTRMNNAVLTQRELLFFLRRRRIIGKKRRKQKEKTTPRAVRQITSECRIRKRYNWPWTLRSKRRRRKKAREKKKSLVLLLSFFWTCYYYS